jgi:DNA polymerase III epsilon subunit-like protein
MRAFSHAWRNTRSRHSTRKSWPSSTIPVVVIDFETTGLSPDHGARATEIAAVLVRDGHIVDRYQSHSGGGPMSVIFEVEG